MGIDSLIAAFILVLSGMAVIGVLIHLEGREANRSVRSFIRIDPQPKKGKR